MRRPGGYATITGVDAVQESDTFTCAHCQQIVHVKPFADPADMGGHCKMCDSLICSKCVDTGKCDPFEKKLERQEAQYQTRRSMGLV